MKNIQRSGLEILELLKSSNQYLPAELSAAILEVTASNGLFLLISCLKYLI